MKRILIGLFASLIMILPAQAQLIRSYGVKAAYTSSNQDYQSTYVGKVEWNRLSGFNAAAYVEWFDVPYVSVVTQVEYAQRGKSWELSLRNADGAPLGTERFWDRTDYLSVPLMGKFRMPVGILAPYIEAGPRIDFYLGYSNNDGWDQHSFYNDFKKVNLGASVGLGSELHAPLLPVTLFLEARYNFDFTDSYSSTNLTVRNNSFDLWLGVGL